GHPEIFPLVFTTKTQEIFNCRVEEDVTEENCFKLIKKEDIIQDLKTRAAISDFHPVKKVVLEYPGEELLVVFDAKFQYGQNFYLVASEEAKENLLKPPETAEEKEEKEGNEETEETLEVHPYKPPVPRPWVSLGSEKEVEEESVKDAVIKIKYMISRVRRKFGAPITFTDKNASHVKDSYVECTSYQDKTFSNKMLEKDLGIQVVPKVREAGTQTKWFYPKNAATQYFPRELSNEEKEESLTSEKLKDFLTSVHLRMEIALQQNEIMNPFFDDWKALAEDESSPGGKPDVSLKAYQTFSDLCYLKDRTISCVCWHPTIYGIIAVSAREQLSSEEQFNLSDKSLLHQSVIVFWSFFDPIHPQLILECPEDIYCFQFSPSDPNVIAGGCINGQIVLWNISEHQEKLQNAKTVADEIKMTAVNTVNASILNIWQYNYVWGEERQITQVQQSTTGPALVKYCTASSIQDSHKKPVTDIHWLPGDFKDNGMDATSENKAKICVRLVTCSPDRSVLFWDVPASDLPEQPPSENVKAENIFHMPPDVPDTFNHLDLCWKPLIKINLCESDSNIEYSPVRISLRELHYHYKNSENTLEVPAKDSPYTETSSPSSKNLKVLENISTNFFVGTEDGEIVYSNWEMEIDSDSAKLKHTQKYTIHTETINTLQRSPFFKDIILSVGGRNFAIWKEGITNGPILQSSCSAGRNTVGHWSLTRPGVFFIGRDDGNIDIWDLLKKTHEPSHFQNISKSMITSISPWIASPKQHFLAVSDDLGVLHVLEICQTLSHASKSEHADVLDYFEREVKYLKHCEQEFQEYQEFQAKTELK
ncbi:WDR63 protein, partial [Aegotheles bennettii]|nr:WDR63 protein [Aegotheles bennettii]